MLQRIYGMNLGILCLLLLVVPIVWAKGASGCGGTFKFG